jgi:putative AlgH/UPF0301 family transcriptional regulator
MSKPLVYRRLYRSLLKASKPFCGSSPDATYISCLLHRTGIDDGVDWETLAAIKVEEAKLDEQAKNSRPLHEARDLSKSYAQPDSSNSDDDATAALKNSLAERKEPERVLFRRLLREVVAGSTSGLKQMQFPKQVDKEALTNVIKREFRLSDHIFDIETRQQVGFLALRELNKKLSRLDELQLEQDVNLDEEGVKLRNQRQAAKHVSPLPLEPKEYLVPGSFLLAHPLLTGYFRRTVICILDHTERSADSDGGTYGLIVNRIGVSPKTGKDQTLQDVLRTIPPQLLDSFGECAVRDGGPVHMSLQMIHSAQENGKVGGTLLQMLTEDKERSVALHTDRAIYYQGDIVHAAGAVKSGELERGEYLQRCLFYPCHVNIISTHSHPFSSRRCLLLRRRKLLGTATARE